MAIAVSACILCCHHEVVSAELPLSLIYRRSALNYLPARPARPAPCSGVEGTSKGELDCPINQSTFTAARQIISGSRLSEATVAEGMLLCLQVLSSTADAKGGFHAPNLGL